MTKNILYVAPTESTFMRVDLEVLSSIAPTTPVYLAQNRSKLSYLKNCLKLAWQIVRSPRIDLVAIWFADYHAGIAVFASLLTGKRSLIFIGGYDAVRYPALGMGVYCSPIRAWFAAYALRHCSLIIANHSALLDSDNLYYSPAGHPEGVYRLIKELDTPSGVVFNALSTKYVPRLDLPRRDQIVTVGNTQRYQDFVNKGFDLLCEVARLRPDWKFIFVGIKADWISKLTIDYNLDSLTNVKIHSWLSQDDLMELFETSRVYAQPSISEGMPNALMEAMYCGCIPVGSPVAGIPEVMGVYGYIYAKRDTYALLNALEQAMISDTDRKAVSEYIGTKFSLQERLSGIKELISKMP